MSDRIITIVITVVTIVITGILGVIGSSLAGGALITALGGATKKDLEDLEAKLPSAAPGTVPGLEAGAVVAFDLANGCPEGWLPMSDLDGRVIVSAGANRAAKYGYRDIGGEEEHTLEQIGQSLGLSRERVRQLEARALKKLRETAPAQNLHPILEP